MGPIGGPDLAAALGVTLRHLYQDIAVLRAVGVEVVNEPGRGYVLPPDVRLPPAALADPAQETPTDGSFTEPARPAERGPADGSPAELVFYTHPLSRGGIVH
ncbi:helix-turn-helix domain-containing protein [Halomonas sp.]|uniref:helix-turn-helix domain-containing protein n=1 Tax=Halomonas sp. TaxID=1486246 RepID=UPI0025C24AF7|nr:helix-turn-helix domain-containing protein [Halomonas sp.]